MQRSIVICTPVLDGSLRGIEIASFGAAQLLNPRWRHRVGHGSRSGSGLALGSWHGARHCPSPWGGGRKRQLEEGGEIPKTPAFAVGAMWGAWGVQINPLQASSWPSFLIKGYLGPQRGSSSQVKSLCIFSSVPPGFAVWIKDLERTRPTETAISSELTKK